jgi:transcription antitermination factor NusG
VSYTRGVRGIVCAGAGPTPVDDKIIELIESQKDADGFVRVDKLLRPCDEATIPEGPLRDLVGVFEGRYEAGERVSVLLTTVTNDATRIKII